MLRDWAFIPAAAYISEKLANDVDYVRFRSVCTFWRSAAPKRPQIPWLVLECRDQCGNRRLRLCNYPNTTDLQLVFNPQPQEEKFFCGSSGGWIALLDDSPGISLYNPFTEAQIDLPLINVLPETYFGGIKKTAEGFAFYRRDGRRVSDVTRFHVHRTFLANHVVLSADPRNQNCIVMSNCYDGKRLIYCRPGDRSWTRLPTFIRKGYFQDFTFYKGRFYVVASNSSLFVYDVGSAALVAEILAAPRVIRRMLLRNYLVVSAGCLLLVIFRLHFLSEDPAYLCEVFRVELDRGQLKLYRLENLGGCSLFLGEESMSVSAGKSPFCKGNCIYFNEKTRIIEPAPDSASSRVRWLNRIGVFDMDDGSISFITTLPMDCCAAHWLTPSLCY